MIIDDPTHVRSQYLNEDNLETRRSVWHPTADGRDPTTEALDAVVAEQPLRVLEIGPGTGGFAARVAAALPGVRLTAIDQSPRFVELTRARGIDAREGDVQDLPFGDEAFDVVAALWMLYHVPNVERALTEIRRVLRPGGLFVAVTNGGGHLADLRREAGGEAEVTGFSTQNGEAQLRAHFTEVARSDLQPRAVFADSSIAEAYLRSSGEDVDWQVPSFDEPREYAGEATIFCCRCPTPGAGWVSGWGCGCRRRGRGRRCRCGGASRAAGPPQRPHKRAAGRSPDRRRPRSPTGRAHHC